MVDLLNHIIITSKNYGGKLTTRRLYTTMDVTFFETEMFFSPQNTHSSIQGETRTDDQNWVSENWIHWDSKRDSDTVDTDPEVENTNLKVGDPEFRELWGDPEVRETKLRELWGDPEVREPELDPDQENLVWQRDSDGQIDSDEGNLVWQRDSDKHEVPDETPLPHKVHDQTFENIHEVQTLNLSNESGRLPFRYNRGQPTNRYLPD